MHFRSQRNEAQVLASISIPALCRRPNHFKCTSGRNAAQTLRHVYKPVTTHPAMPSSVWPTGFGNYA